VLNSEKAEAIIVKQTPMDRATVERVKKALAKKGVVLAQSEEIDRNLISRGIEAAVLDPGGIILMHTKVSASGFFEELIHYGQIQSRRFDMELSTEIIRMEIEAQERLIKHQKIYHITDDEITVLTENLEHYKMELEEKEIGGL